MGPLGDLGGLLVRFLSIFIDFGVDFGTLLEGFGASGVSWGLLGALLELLGES